MLEEDVTNRSLRRLSSDVDFALVLCGFGKNILKVKVLKTPVSSDRTLTCRRYASKSGVPEEQQVFNAVSMRARPNLLFLQSQPFERGCLLDPVDLENLQVPSLVELHLEYP